LSFMAEKGDYEEEWQVSGGKFHELEEISLFFDLNADSDMSPLRGYKGPGTVDINPMTIQREVEKWRHDFRRVSICILEN